MQGSAWINLLRRIPANLHNTLALGLVTGEEVLVQQLIRMENDFMIVRGRMSGSTAEGRVMMVPYAHLTLAALNQRLSEPEVQAIFAPADAAHVNLPAAPTAASGAAASASAAPVLPPNAGLLDLPGATAPGAPKPSPPSKSVLLARLRERLAEKAK